MNMKKQLITLALTILCIGTTFAQISIDSALSKFHYNADKKILFERIQESDLSKAEMYKNAKEWVAINYRDYKKVIDLDDEVNGVIVFKGVSGINDGLLVHKFSYTVEMTIKDKKARLRLFDIFNLTYAGYPVPIETTLQVLKDKSKGNPKLNGEFVDQQYDLFSNLLSEIAKIIIIKDDF
jgi:hypothetical protein